MSKVYKRTDSPYYWITYKKGKERIRESSGTKIKTLANEVLRHREHEALFSGSIASVKKITLNEYKEEYLKWVEANKRSDTIRSYKTILKVFFLFLEVKEGLKRLSQIDLKLLEDYKQQRLTEVKTCTVKNHIIVIKAFFNKAVEWGYLSKNPAKKLNSVEITDSKPIKFLTEDEYKKFMETCQRDFSEYYPMFYTFIHTGMRKGELMNLEWNDIDLKKGYIYVRSKEGFMPKGISKKTGRAKERIIPIHEGVKKEIQLIPKKTKKVFGLHRRPRRVLIRIAKKSGIRDLTRLHELRHSYASFLLNKGVDIYKIKELLGHADIKDTMKYAHLPTVYMKEDVEMLRDLD